MAHELSHVTQRHISRLLTQQSRQTPLLLGAMVLGALAASRTRRHAGAGGGRPGAGPAKPAQFFRATWSAGRFDVGMGLMDQRASRRGFVGMFDKLQQANRINDNGSWPYLRSHPLTTQRSRHAVAPALGRVDGEQPSVLPGRACHGGHCAGAGAVRPGVDVLRQWVAEPQRAGFLQRCRQRAGGRAGMRRRWAPASCGMRQGRGAGQASCSNWSERCCSRRLAKLLRAELELAADDAPLRWRPCRRGFNAGPRCCCARKFCAHRPVERRDGAAADLAGDPPARCFGVAGDGSGLECAGPATACRCRQRRKCMRRATTTPRRWTASRPGGIWRGAALRPTTTSRRRSSTPGCAPCNHCFVNRPPSADSITRPRAE